MARGADLSPRPVLVTASAADHETPVAGSASCVIGAGASLIALLQ
jgi:hypothetical protein